VNLTRGENGRPGGGRGQGERLSRGGSAAGRAWGLATGRLSDRAAVISQAKVILFHYGTLSWWRMRTAPVNA